MKAKQKTRGRLMSPDKEHARSIVSELLREEDSSDEKHGFIQQSTAKNKPIFRLSLLCRAQCGNDHAITEIERRFREEAVQTYTPESIAEEIAFWGIPRRILDDALRDPDDAEKLRTLHRVFPGAIFCFRETLDSITQHAVAALVSNDAIEIQKAKRWLDTVLYVHHKKGRHTISLGVRQLGPFPRLYEEVVFLKKVAVILRKEGRFVLNNKRLIKSIIPLLCKRLDIPSSGKAKEWLLNILSSASQKPVFNRPITAAAAIISECTQLMDSKPGSKASGYQATSIRKYISLVHSDWAKQRIRIEDAAKLEADAFCKTIDGGHIDQPASPRAGTE